MVQLQAQGHLGCGSRMLTASEDFLVPALQETWGFHGERAGNTADMVVMWNMLLMVDLECQGPRGGFQELGRGRGPTSEMCDL